MIILSTSESRLYTFFSVVYSAGTNHTCSVIISRLGRSSQEVTEVAVLHSVLLDTIHLPVAFGVIKLTEILLLMVHAHHAYLACSSKRRAVKSWLPRACTHTRSIACRSDPTDRAESGGLCAAAFLLTR